MLEALEFTGGKLARSWPAADALPAASFTGMHVTSMDRTLGVGRGRLRLGRDHVAHRSIPGTAGS